MLRQVIQLLLDRAKEIEVVGEAPDLDDALEEAQNLQPDVILMNDYLPPIDSAHATKLFREAGLFTPILIISMEIKPDMIPHSLASGANGFMYKDEMGTFLTEAIRAVYNGEQYLSPLATSALSDEVR